jgi:serine/threonine protein kinase/sugar lactone lactonase YvrE
MSEGETHRQSRARLVAGRYWLLNELGRGGMGTVWLADDQLVHRQVAVKELRPPHGLASDDLATFRRRALAEATSAARIHHPNAVTLYDVIPATADDDAVYLIMELIEGPTLGQLIQAQGRLPDATTAGYGLQLLDVLEAAHALGITHRDVKPANIMITAGGQAKLTDFGIAHIAGDARLTRSGVMGTQAYMAPELFESQPITPAADLWALGATLYAAAHGRGPFDRDTTSATLRAILLDDLPAPCCGPALATAITGLLERDPARRATASQAGPALSQAATQASTSAPPAPPTPWEQAKTTLSKTAPPAPPPSPVSPSRRKPPRRNVITAAIVTAPVIAACIAGAIFLTARGPLPGTTSPAAASALASVRPVATLDDPNAEAISSISFSSDSSVLTSGSASGIGISEGAWLWNTATGRELDTGVNPDAFQSDAVLSPDGSTMAFANLDYDGNTVIDMWSLASQKVTAALTLPASAGTPSALAFSPDGTMLAVGDSNNPAIYLYDVATGTSATLTDPNDLFGDVNSVAFSPNGAMLAVGDARSGELFVWNVASRSLIATLTIPGAGNSTVLDAGGIAFSTDGGTLAVADEAKGVLLWNVATRTWGPSIAVSASMPQDVVAYSPDGKTLATAGEEGDITLWNIASRTAITSWAQHDNAVVSVMAFSPDGRTLATGNDNGSAYLWNAASLP